MSVKAGRDISKGEHLSIMYTHSLWGTQARRAHLYDTKKFWCLCPRCKDATEFGKFLARCLARALGMYLDKNMGRKLVDF